MDVLRELSDEEIFYICEKFEEKLPYTLKDLYYIKSNLKFREASRHHQNLSEKVLPKFYTHRYGKKEHCTIFGITGKNDHAVYYFSFDESHKEIKECLKSKYIMWGTKFMFETIHVEQIEPILDYVKENDLYVEENAYASYYTLPKSQAKSFSIEIPQGTLLRKLKSEDAEFCNSIWVFRDENSEIWIRSLIEIHGGYALIHETTKEILSFGLISSQYAIGCLTTVDKARRQGYAEIIVKLLANELEKLNLTPYAYIQNINTKSINLFLKLGFEKVSGSNWIVIG